MLKRIKDSIFDILRQADWLLLCLCCGAALFGLVMIASATNFLNSWKMVIVQACAIVLGVGIYFLMSQIDLTEAAKRWKWLLGFGIVMFLLLKTPLGIENNGNRAWLGIQGFPANIQPAEIVKLTFILVLSRQLVWVKENWGLKSLRSIAFLAGHVLLMVGLYYVISSDMGSALVYVFIFAAMAFVAGVAARWFIIALLGGGAAFYLLWELDKMEFYIPETGETIKAKHRPIVIITSNAEKELPSAFLRRCIFHYISFPDRAQMEEIVRVHFDQLDEALLQQTLDAFYRIREMDDIEKKPSTSELVDWIHALMLSGIPQEDILKKIPFAGVLLKKDRDLEVLRNRLGN